MRLNDPFADRKYEAASARPPGPKGVEHPIQINGRDRRPIVLDPGLEHALACSGADRDSAIGWRPLQSVLKQVRQHAANLQLVNLDWRQVLSEVDGDLVAFQVCPQLAHGGSDQIREPMWFLVELHPGLQARQREHVADEVIEPRSLAVEVVQKLLLLGTQARLWGDQGCEPGAQRCNWAL